MKKCLCTQKKNSSNFLIASLKVKENKENYFSYSFMYFDMPSSYLAWILCDSDNSCSRKIQVWKVWPQATVLMWVLSQVGLMGGS